MFARIWAKVRTVLTFATSKSTSGLPAVPPQDAQATSWLKEQELIAEVLFTRGAALFPDAPPFDPDPQRWPAVVQPGDEVANCTPYAYAFTADVNGKLDPGAIAQRFRFDEDANRLQSARQRLDPDGIRALLERDGLVPAHLDDLQEPHPGQHVVAVWVDPSRGYHLARLDRGGTWSEKPGTHGVQLRSIQEPLDLLRFSGDGVTYSFVGFHLFDPGRVYSRAPLSVAPHTQQVLASLK